MGVPGLYRWLVQRYPLIRRRANDLCRPKFTHFYIDFNCIVYNSLPLVKVTDNNFNDLFHEIGRYLDTIVHVIRPKDVIFIAVDGPAPFAKCSQQRSRRFVSARDHNPENFDKTAISVGTVFMEQLNEFLKSFFRMKTMSDPVWRKPQLIYSSHRVPGEGEHKFLEYLRKQKRMNLLSEEMVHCVYSPDADLIFLGLQTREPNFYILRECDSWIGPNENVGNARLNKLRSSGNDYELLSLSLLREYFKLDYNEIDDIDRLIDEFATFSFLLGNDFIPHFPDVFINDGDFGLIVKTYQESLMKNHLFLVEDRKINKKNLKIFLENVVKAFHEKQVPKAILKLRAKPEYDFKKEGEDKRYMAEKYPDDYSKSPIEFERKISHSVLDSFDWVLEYYTKGCCSWTWCYSYFYAPPLSIVIKYCDDHQSHFELDRPPCPFEQLLCILPPQCSGMLPEPLGKLMYEPSIIAKYFPSTFKIDLNGRRYEHEGVVLIPNIDVNEVRKEFADIKSEISPNDLARNELEQEFLFFNGNIKNYEPEKDKIEHIAEEIFIKPSFYNIPIKFKSSNSEKIDIHVFTLKSTEVSVAIIPSFENLTNNIEDVKQLKGSIVYVNWPYISPAYISDVILLNDKQMNIIKNEYKEKYGILLVDNKIALKVHMLKYSNELETKLRIQSKSYYVPYQLSYPITNKKYLSSMNSNNKDETSLSEGTQVIIKDNGINRVANITSIEGDMVNLSLVGTKDLSGIKTILEKEDDEWVSINYLEAQLHINSNILLKILSILRCDKQFISFTAFYKNNKSNINECVLDGSCKKLPNNEYSFTKEFCSHFYEYLDNPLISNLKLIISKSQDDDERFAISSNELWGKDSIRAKKELEKFFTKEAYCKKFFLIDKDIDIISQCSLQKIEDLVISSKQEQIQSTIKIPISSIVLRPGQSKTKMDNFSIGCRVIFIGNSGSIPFGSVGTIIGIDKQNFQYHIILDDEYEYAHCLRNRLKTKRGFLAFSDDLIPTE